MGGGGPARTQNSYASRRAQDWQEFFIFEKQMP